MKPLIPSLLKDANSVRLIKVVVPPAGTPYEDLLRPEFWTHIGHLFQPGYRIEVYPEDSAYYAELLVLNAGPRFAQVVELRHVPLNATETRVAASAECFVEWAGPAHRFRVRRQSDGEIMQTGFQTRDLAIQYARNMEPKAA